MPIHTPQPAPSSRPTAARNNVIVRFLAISPPENRSTNAAKTASGDGRKSLLTSCALQAKCHTSPKRMRGAIRTIQRAPENKGLLRKFAIPPPRRQCLAPHREPDLITDAVELLRDHKFFAGTATVERNGKFFDDLTRSCRHDADAVREVNRFSDIVGD